MDLHTSILNELSAQEASRFEAFSKVCADRGLLSPPASLKDEDVRDGLNDEATLLRFLRARSFDVGGAVKQFQEAITARESNHILQLYDEIDVTTYENARRLYPHWCGRRDKQGHPICMFDLAYLNRATLVGYEKSRGMNLNKNLEGTGAGSNTLQRACVVHDYLTRFVLPLCSAMRDRPNPEVPITGAVYLADISEFGLRQGWDVRNYTQDISKLLALSYPEIIDRVFVLNAPPYFAMMWGVIKKWMDPVTAAKLVILTPSEVLPTLASFIDLDNIPTKFGGAFHFTQGMTPNVDSGISRALIWSSWSGKTFPLGQLKWNVDLLGRRTAVAVGSIDGIPRVEPVAVLRPLGDTKGDTTFQQEKTFGNPSKNIKEAPIKLNI